LRNAVNQAYEPGFDGLGDALLEVVGVVGVDVARQVEHEAALGVLDLLQADLEAVVPFVVKSRYNVVVAHGAPLPGQTTIRTPVSLKV
jgi:hypothetical protein